MFNGVVALKFILISPLFLYESTYLCIDISIFLSVFPFISLWYQDGGGNYKGKYQVLSSSSTLTINVVDTQDTPPIFVGSPYFGYVYEVSSPVSL